MTKDIIQPESTAVAIHSHSESTRVGGIQYKQELVKNNAISKEREFMSKEVKPLKARGKSTLAPFKMEQDLVTELRDYPMNFLQSNPLMRVSYRR